MAHKLDKHYSDFGGIDTRSNKLNQNPKSARSGSKNFRWSENDELMNREGFQRKSDEGAACEAGLIEYRYKDINTGEAKSEVLGVAFDGKLRRRVVHNLKITRNTLSSVYYYSFYYDTDAATHKFDLLSSTYTVLGSVTVGASMTLAQLDTAIDALALTDLSASVVDEDGDAVAASTALAINLDWKYREAFNTASNGYKLNSSGIWEEVLTPDGVAPFTNAVAGENDPDWEGISYENLNNAVYITDGGFPYKYDGHSVYRAGMPKNIAASYSGTTASYDAGTAGPGVSTTGTRWLSYQYIFKDPSGGTTVGKINGQDIYPIDESLNGYEQIAVNILDAAKSCSFAIKRIAQTAHFPIYACAPSTTQTFSGSGSKTINVKSGHNLSAGMILRMTTRSTTIASVVYYAEITATTSNTITVNCTNALPGVFNVYGVSADICLNGFYGPDYLHGKYHSVYPGTTGFSQDIWGPYICISSTTTSGGMTGTRYFWSIAGIPHNSSHEYTVATSVNDSVLTVAIDEFGEDLPRACKYLASWQGQLVQAGRPYSSVADTYYPSLYTTPPTNLTDWARNNLYYSEAHNCDFQSIYWSDSANPEGFPQSGANEESFENQAADQITGLGANKEALFAFKQETTGYLTGSLATGDLVKEFLEDDTGSACHGAIQKVKGAIVFMDEFNGFYAVVAGRLPEYIGFPIQDYFTKNHTKSGSEKLNFKRARSANFKAMNLYLCYVPAGTESDPSSNSVLFVYDYGVDQVGKPRNCWYVWQGVNAAGGILSTANSELLISSKASSSRYLQKLKRTGSVYDHADHLTAIEWNYKGAFLTMGAPVIDKAWVRCVISSVLGGFSLRVDQYANFFDTIVGSLNLTFASSGRKNQNLDVKANGDKLKSLSWGFYNNTIFEAVRIDGWEIEYAPAFDVGEAKK